MIKIVNVKLHIYALKQILVVCFSLFQYSRAMAQVVEEMVRHFADTPLLDILNVTLYHEALEDYTQELETSKGQLLAQHGLYLGEYRQ